MLVKVSSGKPLFIIFVLFFFVACTPRALIRYYPNIIEKSLTNKIKTLESSFNNNDLSDEQLLELIQFKVQYGYGYLLEQADRVQDDNYFMAINLQDRAQMVFIEAIGLAKDELVKRHHSFNDWLNKPLSSNIDFSRKDVPIIYWLAAAYGGIISSSRANPKWVIHLPKIGILLEAGIQIDPTWNYGALYSAMISFTASRPDAPVDVREVAQSYFDLAIQVSKKQDAAPYLAFAENISVKEQNKIEFMTLTNFVLKMDINKNPDLRLSNIISQERARWLQSKVDDLFYE